MTPKTAGMRRRRVEPSIQVRRPKIGYQIFFLDLTSVAWDADSRKAVTEGWTGLGLGSVLWN